MPRMPREQQQTCYVITDSSTDVKIQVLRDELLKKIEDSKSDCTIGATLTVSNAVGNTSEEYAADTKLSDIVTDMLTSKESPVGTFSLYVYEGEAPLDED